jgi:hypothetical protein
MNLKYQRDKGGNETLLIRVITDGKRNGGNKWKICKGEVENSNTNELYTI